MNNITGFRLKFVLVVSLVIFVHLKLNFGLQILLLTILGNLGGMSLLLESNSIFIVSLIKSKSLEVPWCLKAYWIRMLIRVKWRQGMKRGKICQLRVSSKMLS